MIECVYAWWLCFTSRLEQLGWDRDVVVVAFVPVGVQYKARRIARVYYKANRVQVVPTSGHLRRLQGRNVEHA